MHTARNCELPKRDAPRLVLFTLKRHQTWRQQASHRTPNPVHAAACHQLAYERGRFNQRGVEYKRS